MSSMCVRAALAVLLLFIATVEADEGGVTFWGEEFTMTCPEEGKFFKEGKELTEEKHKHTLKYDDKGLYHCAYGENKYYFYVRGKTCTNCFEVDANLFGLAIAADVVGTLIVMIIIYRCTKKKSSAGPLQTSKATARKGGRAPAVPSPDYEPLNLQTRSQDPYSVVNRMG
ncbi:T-cell surface glycoprotein CD3 epsilon chain [Notothenia coriiceps]|uniref:T-cell surface glycoprotein CD3 epsilon chain n=1 Tax=Notothenia coriiceps TaxID=8208 RepID=A0A6I9P9T8_9TELE|nr:PREDICTED: T-cell surface glycoprotein CD3 epsilon chain [Notothenia coriiceps]